MGAQPAKAAESSAKRLLEQAGSTYACGVNHVGQLGLGDSLPRETFRCISALRGKNVDQLSAVSSTGSATFLLSAAETKANAIQY